MTQSNQNTPSKESTTSPMKKDEQSKNPAAANSPSTDKSGTDKR